MSECMIFHMSDDSCGQVSRLSLTFHLELMMRTAFRGLNELPVSSPGFSCATVQCISVFLLVSVYICIVFQIWSRSILVWALCICLSPHPL